MEVEESSNTGENQDSEVNTVLLHKSIAAWLAAALPDIQIDELNFIYSLNNGTLLGNLIAHIFQGAEAFKNVDMADAHTNLQQEFDFLAEKLPAVYAGNQFPSPQAVADNRESLRMLDITRKLIENAAKVNEDREFPEFALISNNGQVEDEQDFLLIQRVYFDEIEAIGSSSSEGDSEGEDSFQDFSGGDGEGAADLEIPSLEGKIEEFATPVAESVRKYSDIDLGGADGEKEEDAFKPSPRVKDVFQETEETHEQELEFAQREKIERQALKSSRTPRLGISPRMKKMPTPLVKKTEIRDEFKPLASEREGVCVIPDREEAPYDKVEDPFKSGDKVRTSNETTSEMNEDLVDDEEWLRKREHKLALERRGTASARVPRLKKVKPTPATPSMGTPKSVWRERKRPGTTGSVLKRPLDSFKPLLESPNVQVIPIKDEVNPFFGSVKIRDTNDETSEFIEDDDDPERQWTSRGKLVMAGTPGKSPIILRKSRRKKPATPAKIQPRNLNPDFTPLAVTKEGVTVVEVGDSEVSVESEDPFEARPKIKATFEESPAVEAEMTEAEEEWTRAKPSTPLPERSRTKLEALRKKYRKSQGPIAAIDPKRSRITDNPPSEDFSPLLKRHDAEMILPAREEAPFDKIEDPFEDKLKLNPSFEPTESTRAEDETEEEDERFRMIDAGPYTSPSTPTRKGRRLGKGTHRASPMINRQSLLKTPIAESFDPLKEAPGCIVVKAVDDEPAEDPFKTHTKLKDSFDPTEEIRDAEDEEDDFHRERIDAEKRELTNPKTPRIGRRERKPGSEKVITPRVNPRDINEDFTPLEMKKVGGFVVEAFEQAPYDKVEEPFSTSVKINQDFETTNQVREGEDNLEDDWTTRKKYPNPPGVANSPRKLRKKDSAEESPQSKRKSEYHIDLSQVSESFNILKETPGCTVVSAREEAPYDKIKDPFKPSPRINPNPTETEVAVDDDTAASQEVEEEPWERKGEKLPLPEGAAASLGTPRLGKRKGKRKQVEGGLKGELPSPIFNPLKETKGTYIISNRKMPQSPRKRKDTPIPPAMPLLHLSQHIASPDLDVNVEEVVKLATPSLGSQEPEKDMVADAIILDEDFQPEIETEKTEEDAFEALMDDEPRMGKEKELQEPEEGEVKMIEITKAAPVTTEEDAFEALLAEEPEEPQEVAVQEEAEPKEPEVPAEPEIVPEEEAKLEEMPQEASEGPEEPEEPEMVPVEEDMQEEFTQEAPDEPAEPEVPAEPAEPEEPEMVPVEEAKQEETPQEAPEEPEEPEMVPEEEAKQEETPLDAPEESKEPEEPAEPEEPEIVPVEEAKQEETSQEAPEEQEVPKEPEEPEEQAEKAEPAEPAEPEEPEMVPVEEAKQEETSQEAPEEQEVPKEPEEPEEPDIVPVEEPLQEETPQEAPEEPEVPKEPEEPAEKAEPEEPAEHEIVHVEEPMQEETPQVAPEEPKETTEEPHAEPPVEEQEVQEKDELKDLVVEEPPKEEQVTKDVAKAEEVAEKEPKKEELEPVELGKEDQKDSSGFIEFRYDRENSDNPVPFIPNTPPVPRMSEAGEVKLIVGESPRIGETGEFMMEVGVEQKESLATPATPTTPELTYGDVKSRLRSSRFVVHSGYDKKSRPVICFIDERMPEDVDFGDMLRYIESDFAELVKQDYVFVVIHHSGSPPGLTWIASAHSQLGRDFKKNLKAFYFVKPSFLAKVALYLMTPYLSWKFFNKFFFISDPEEILEYVDIDQLDMGTKLMNELELARSRKGMSGTH